ncbi:MAG: xanthine dehydrogenase family protein subunit M [Desulfobacterales bacterium]|nr:xanthine dehydrogenase family protein subunit M [Desulfobacterales bacterium]
MQSFEYAAARSLSEAAALLSRGEGVNRVLAGGTDLIVQLREGRRTAALLVDVKPIPELNLLEFDPAGGLLIGAAVACYRICAHAPIAAAYPGLVDAVSLIGGTQIQGRASLGGNLCNASPAADSIPALIVHRAVCLIHGPNGSRVLAVENFCSAPGRNALLPGEFLVSVRLPAPPPGFGAAYLRFIPRNEMDIAVACAGASVILDEKGSTFLSARVALGAVAPVPLFVPEAGEWLVGRPVSAESIEAAARIAQEAARPIDDMRGTAEQRKRLCYVLTRRALEKAAARARAA